MELNSLIYFSEAAKDLNFTRTAKRLYISQQNLSNHIARLEAYYDVKLFERTPRLTLTYAGQTLLAYANNLRLDEENLKQALIDIKQKEKGTLHIGGSPSRSSIVMPILAERFAQRYPQVELHFHHHHSSVLAKMLLDGELDFSIGVDKLRHPNLTSIPLFRDTLYLMVSEDLLQAHISDHVQELIQTSQAGVRIRDFQALPFVNIQSSNIISDCFADAGCQPHFAVTSNFPQFLLPYHYENIAASIITRTMYLHIRDFTPEHIHFFPVIPENKIMLNDISFTQHKRKYLSQYGQYFSQVAMQYFQELDRIDSK